MKIHSVIKAAVVLLFMVALSIPGMAKAEYPDGPINMVIAFTAGGSSDVQARIIQKYWNKYSDQRLVFVYKPGAGGAIGFSEIAHSKPDGYTIGGLNVPHIILQPLVQKAPFGVEDFDYICQVINDPQVVAVRKDSPFKSIKDLFAYAQANPKKLLVGLVGPNSGHHLMFLDVKDKYDFPVSEVFYKGAADQNAALLGGEVGVMFGNLNDVMRSQDEMRILAIASEKRNDFMPDVPTMREQGYDVVSYIRRGFAAPKGLPQDKLDYLTKIFKDICTDPGYVADLKTAGQPGEYASGAEFKEYVLSQFAKDKAALEKAGLLK